MNEAHLHLILGHFPIVLLPTGLIFLLISIKFNNKTLERVALSFFFISAIFVFAVFQFGEGAEELIEHLERSSKSVIHEHEEAGEVSVWLCGILGFLSLCCYLPQLRNLRPLFLKIILLLSIISAVGLAFTAYRGGKISHPEAYEIIGDGARPLS